MAEGRAKEPDTTVSHQRRVSWVFHSFVASYLYAQKSARLGGYSVYVISLIVKNEFGVMQRVMGEFTRNKINVETIVVGKCELKGKSRIVLSVIDKDVAEIAIGRLQKLQDVYDAELVPESGQSAYALLSTSSGNVGVVGGSDQVEELIDRSKPDRYVKALNAL